MMIQISQTFPTEIEALAWVEAYYDRYHPCGYGTALRLAEGPDGTVLVTGYRYASCD